MTIEGQVITTIQELPVNEQAVVKLTTSTAAK